MADIIALPLKGSYDAALRAQDPFRAHSKGYPALRDPAADRPVGMLQGMGQADERKMRLHYGPAIQNSLA